jgi:CRP-like cAMP-binding protein
MNVGSRHFPTYDEEHLRGMSRTKLHRHAMHLRDVLNLSDEPPFRQLDLEEWILTRQAALKQDHGTIETRLLKDPHEKDDRSMPIFVDTEPRYGTTRMKSTATDTHGKAGHRHSYQKSGDRNVHERYGSPRVADLYDKASPCTAYDTTEKEAIMLRKIALQVLLCSHTEDAEHTQYLMDNFRRVSYARGEEIMREGDDVSADEPALLVLNCGTFSIFRGSNRVGRVSSQGACLGELNLFHGFPRTRSICADTECEFFAFARRDISQIMKELASRQMEFMINTFRAMPILRNIPRAKLERLFSVMDVCRYRRGDYVIEAGQLGNSMFILEKGGCVACSRTNTLSIKTLKRYERGDWFGELALMDDTSLPRQCDVVVESSMATVLQIERSGFKEVIGPLGLSVLHNAAVVETHWSMDSHVSQRQIEPIIKIDAQPKHFAGKPRGRNYTRKDPPRLHFRYDDNDGTQEVNAARLPGVAAVPSLQQREEILQELRRKKIFGNLEPSNEDLLKLAMTFILHRVSAGDILAQEGVKATTGQRIFMLEQGEVKLLKQGNASERTGRPVMQGFGTRITFYKNPFDFIGNMLVQLNHAPYSSTIMCETRSCVVSVDIETAEQVLAPLIAARRRKCLDIMRNISLLNELNDDKLGRLLDAVGCYHFQQGDFIVQAGEMSSEMYIIESGEVAFHGKKGALTGTLSDGGTLYEKALVDDCLVAADVVVKSPEAFVLGLSRSTFNQVLGKFVLKVRGEEGSMEVDAAGREEPSTKRDLELFQCGSSAGSQSEKGSFEPPPRNQTNQARARRGS